MRTANINKLSTIIVFCILESTIFWRSQSVGYDNLKSTVYVLLVLLTSGLMINLIVTEKHKQITPSVLHTVIIIMIVGSGSLSAFLVGSQTHFEEDGAMRGFGLPMRQIILGTIYPVTFSLFIIFLGLVLWTAYILFRSIRIKTPFRSATQ